MFLLYNSMHFVVFNQRSEGGNMAGTKTLSYRWLLCEWIICSPVVCFFMQYAKKYAIFTRMYECKDMKGQCSGLCKCVRYFRGINCCTLPLFIIKLLSFKTNQDCRNKLSICDSLCVNMKWLKVGVTVVKWSRYGWLVNQVTVFFVVDAESWPFILTLLWRDFKTRDRWRAIKTS